MWPLSGFTDEAAWSLTQQIALARDAGLDGIELRRAGGRPVVRWSRAAVLRARAALADAGLQASCVATGIGKVGLGQPQRARVAEFDRAIRVAHAVGTPYVRVFSFRVPAGSENRHLTQAVDRLGELVRRAEQADVVLLHENEKGIVGSSPERCASLAAGIDSPHLQLILDPANFVQCGYRPASEAYPALARWVSYLHVKDAVAATGRVVRAGEGDAEWPALLAALRADSFVGTASVEPHLGLGGRGGPCQPRTWRSAVDAYRGLL